jgi:hypothetical protein
MASNDQAGGDPQTPSAAATHKVDLSQTCDNDRITGLQLPGNVSTSAGAFSRLLYQSQFAMQAPNL